MTRDELINEKLILTEEEITNPLTDIKIIVHRISAIQSKAPPAPPQGWLSSIFSSGTIAGVQDPEIFIR